MAACAGIYRCASRACSTTASCDVRLTPPCTTLVASARARDRSASLAAICSRHSWAKHGRRDADGMGASPYNTITSAGAVAWRVRLQLQVDRKRRVCATGAAQLRTLSGGVSHKVWARGCISREDGRTGGSPDAFAARRCGNRDPALARVSGAHTAPGQSARETGLGMHRSTCASQALLDGLWPRTELAGCDGARS